MDDPVNQTSILKPFRRLVIVETPYGKNPPFYTTYARRALADSLYKGEAPFASHLLYPQILDEALPEERALGIQCNLDIMFHAFQVAVYNDYGISTGMRIAITHAENICVPVVYRSIGS